MSVSVLALIRRPIAVFLIRLGGCAIQLWNVRLRALIWLGLLPAARGLRSPGGVLLLGFLAHTQSTRRACDCSPSGV